MKSLLKFTCLMLMLVGITSLGFGQATTNIAATAEVRTTITFDVGVGTIDFGYIPAVVTTGNEPQVAADGTTTNTLGGTSAAADFTIQASPSTSLDVTYGQTTTLDDGTSNFNIGFNTLVVSNTTDDASTGATTQTGGSFTTSTSASGDLYIFAGGKLDTYNVSAQTTPATLTAASGGGNITFSVSYN